MKAVCLDGLPDTCMQVPASPNGALALCRTGDHTAELHGSEMALIALAGPMRHRTFSSGRRAAKAALSELGIVCEALGVRDRLPRWPNGVSGSITHTDELSGAIAIDCKDIAGAGVDLQRVSSVSERVAKRILLPEERARVASSSEHDWNTAFFSAKESVYKAIRPVAEEFLGFADVRICFDEATASFRASTITRRTSSELLSQGSGYMRRIEGHWLTLFLIPSVRATD